MNAWTRGRGSGSAPPYVELHLHTAYSFLDGASLPEEMVARAAELGHRALAITDHDGLHGAMEFARAARAAGITPITGTEVTLTEGAHLTLLAETGTGFALDEDDGRPGAVQGS